jgi:hypothetical protein
MEIRAALRLGNESHNLLNLERETRLDSRPRPSANPTACFWNAGESAPLCCHEARGTDQSRESHSAGLDV